MMSRLCATESRSPLQTEADDQVIAQRSLAVTHGLAEDLVHTQVAFDAGDPLDVEAPNPDIWYQIAQHRKLYTSLTERRQDLLDVGEEDPVGTDDEYALALQWEPVGVKQVGRAVQCHHRLASARAALDDQRAWHRRPDHFVLLTLNRGDDVAQTAGPRRLQREGQSPPSLDGGVVVDTWQFVQTFTEVLVLETQELTTPGCEVASPHQPHRLAASRPEEGLGYGSAPIDEHGIVVGTPDPDPADVIAVAAAIAVLIDPAETQRGVTDVELAHPVVDRFLNHVPFEASLMGSAGTGLDHVMKLGGLLAGSLEARIGKVDVGLLRFVIGMSGHLAEGSTFEKRGTFQPSDLGPGSHDACADSVPPVERSLSQSEFVRACRGEQPAHVPVWFMRQAGRSLPEYREIRGSGSILDAIANPDLATEITLQPVRRYGVDAAILYSDIVVPVHAIGFGVDVVPGVGPVVEQPFSERADLDRLRPLDPGTDTPYVLETVQNLVAELDVPLIGFAGAPFTVCSYLVEGRPSRTYERTKALMLGDPDLWFELTDRLADLAIASLRSQIEAGAAAVQLFDSWAGSLSPAAYRKYVMPATRKVLDSVADFEVPRIIFGVGTGELLGHMADTGADVVGVDWRVPLDEARRRVGERTALQGNLDPAACMAPWSAVAEEVRAVIGANGGHPGWVFNLGHGVLPETDPGVLKRIVELVHDEGRSAS